MGRDLCKAQGSTECENGTFIVLLMIKSAQVELVKGPAGSEIFRSVLKHLHCGFVMMCDLGL